jgi:hypothetical protein
MGVDASLFERRHRQCTRATGKHPHTPVQCWAIALPPYDPWQYAWRAEMHRPVSGWPKNGGCFRYCISLDHGFTESQPMDFAAPLLAAIVEP